MKPDDDDDEIVKEDFTYTQIPVDMAQASLCTRQKMETDSLCK